MLADMSSSSVAIFVFLKCIHLTSLRSHHGPKPLIMDTILDNIGNTPLVRINSIGKSGNVTHIFCYFSHNNSKRV